MKWTIPYIDQSITFWYRIKKNFDQSIKSVYLPLNDPDISSGRQRLPLQYYNLFLESRLFEISLTLNPVILEKPLNQIKEKILKHVVVYKEKYRLKDVVISNIELAEYLKTQIPDLKITGSVIMDIKSPEQLLYLEDTLDTIVPSVHIMRNIPELKKLKAGFHGKIKLMVNELCLPGCPTRIQHFYDLITCHFNNHYCNNLPNNKQWIKLISAWVLPEHLDFFDEVADEYKLEGRINLRNPDDYFLIFSSYINREPVDYSRIKEYKAFLLFRDIPITREYYKKTLYCAKNCNRCEFCKQYYKEMRQKQSGSKVN